MNVKRMLLSFSIIFVLTTSSLFAIYVSGQPTPEQTAASEKIKGPYADELIFRIVEESEVQTLMVEKGDIAIGDWQVTPEKIDELKAKGITVSVTPQAGVFYIALNNQVWPTSELAFRKAVAHLIDSEDILKTAYQGYAIAMNTMIPPFYGEWYNPNVKTYEFSTDLARQELLDAGWKYDADKHTWTDPKGNILSWDKPIALWARTDPGRKYAAEQLAKNAKAADIPITAEVASRTEIFKRLYYSNPPDYVMATAGYLFPPPVDLDGLTYSIFHSSQDFLASETPVSWGPNFHRVRDPDFDKVAETVHSSPDKKEVLQAAWKAQELMAEKAFTVPMYTWVVINAYNENFGGQKREGFVNQANIGIFNSFTFLNMSSAGRKAGGSVTVAMLGDLDKFNILLMGISLSVWEAYAVSGNPFAIYDYAGVADPNNPVEVLPWAAKTWKAESTAEGQKITITLRDDMKFHDGVPVTGEDYAFSIKLWRDTVGPASVWAVDVADAKAVAKYTVEVDLKSASYWRLPQILTLAPILPKHIWERHDPQHANDWAAVQPEKTGELIGSGPFIFKEHKPGEFVRVALWKDYFKSPLRVPPTVEKFTVGQAIALKLPSGVIRYPMNVSASIRDAAGNVVYAEQKVILDAPGFPKPGQTVNIAPPLSVGQYTLTASYIFNFTLATIIDPVTGEPMNITRGTTFVDSLAFQMVEAPPARTITTTQTTTELSTVVDYTITAGAAVAALIVGAVVSYLATRRRRGA